MTDKAKRLDAMIAEAVAESDRAFEAEQRGDEPLRADTIVTRGRGRSRVLQVRLTDEEYAMLEARASRTGVPVSTLARSILFGGTVDVTEAVENALRHALRPDLLRTA